MLVPKDTLLDKKAKNIPQILQSLLRVMRYCFGRPLKENTPLIDFCLITTEINHLGYNKDTTNITLQIC
uniref:Uncharacterized protein n=1 Tax=Timema monikensis TaxID=170555 RepID=A0A7R9E4E6_9NEOP|nr:unnamed protein product [Timema monikensis]